MNLHQRFCLLLIVLMGCVVVWSLEGCTHASVAQPVRSEDSKRASSDCEASRSGAHSRPSEEAVDSLRKPGLAGRGDSSHEANSLPSSPIKKREQKPDEKARLLFEYARRENSSLRWDECLASKALIRARTMVKERRFAHKDPQTGENPAWALVASCFEPAYAGENLAKGEKQSAKAIHEALMESPAHRRNILSPKFERLGVGCYEYICVQLFAGF